MSHLRFRIIQMQASSGASAADPQRGDEGCGAGCDPLGSGVSVEMGGAVAAAIVDVGVGVDGSGVGV